MRHTRGVTDAQIPELDVPTAVDEVIRTRRTSLLMDPDDPVPDELISILLELATWAPNHKRTWPWRFTVITGDARYRLGEALAAVLQRAIADGTDSALYYGNAEIALSNVQAWLAHAKAGTLLTAYGPSGFGISKSDLMFGAAERCLYELEGLFVLCRQQVLGRATSNE